MFLLLFKRKGSFLVEKRKSGLSNGNQVDGKVLQTFQKSFVQVQDILDQNRLLINEINQNHESKIPDNLTRNVGLIKELNNNIRRVVDLYADLSSNFTRSMEPSSEGESSGILKSNGKANSKRIRSGLWGGVGAGDCVVTLSIIVLLDYSSLATIGESNFVDIYLTFPSHADDVIALHCITVPPIFFTTNSDTNRQ
uniref:Protein EARLY FLOWERING 4 domain-containing protein n=1 Tax=Salix viminalis TaxID=40686 RepID=A0A6N2MU79_SALVM